MAIVEWDELVEYWLARGEVDRSQASLLADELDSFLETSFSQFDILIAKEEPDAALLHLSTTVSIINAAAGRIPSIIPKLEKWIRRFQTALNALANKLKADGFSIGIAFPPGISLEISFSAT